MKSLMLKPASSGFDKPAGEMTEHCFTPDHVANLLRGEYRFLRKEGASRRGARWHVHRMFDMLYSVQTRMGWHSSFPMDNTIEWFVEHQVEEKYDLVFVDYRDQLSDEQIAAIFETGEYPDLDANGDWESEQRWANAREAAREAMRDTVLDVYECHTEGGRILSEDERFELEQALIEVIEERDQSDPFSELLRFTPSMLLRYRLGTGDETDVEPNSWSWDGDQWTENSLALAVALGVDEATYHDQIYELLANASYGGSLWVLWNGSVDDLVMACLDGKPRTITWTDLEVLVLDRFNGSGHSVTFEGLTITRTFDRSMLKLDSQDWGYGWDEVAGLVHSAFNSEPTLTVVADGNTEKEGA